MRNGKPHRETALDEWAGKANGPPIDGPAAPPIATNGRRFPGKMHTLTRVFRPDCPWRLLVNRKCAWLLSSTEACSLHPKRP